MERLGGSGALVEREGGVSVERPEAREGPAAGSNVEAAGALLGGKG